MTYRSREAGRGLKATACLPSPPPVACSGAWRYSHQPLSSRGREPLHFVAGAEGALTLMSTSFFPPPKMLPRKKSTATTTTIKKITTIATTPVLLPPPPSSPIAESPLVRYIASCQAADGSPSLHTAKVHPRIRLTCQIRPPFHYHP